jgi:hypothetical protein
MKKLILLIQAFFLINEINAQGYVPLHLDVGTTWLTDISQTPPSGMGNTQYFREKFTVEKDTLVQALQYAKIRATYYKLINFDWHVTSPSAYFYLRNDTTAKKVYYCDSSFTEHLHFNFNLNITDTLVSYRSFPFCNANNPIDSIKQVSYFGTIRNKFIPKLDTMPSFVPKGSLIEGIGATNGFLDYAFQYVPFECFYEINTSCVTFNNQTLYNGQNSNLTCSCEFYTIPAAITEIAITEKDITIFPNPFSNTLNLDMSKLKSQSVNIKIYDVTGKLCFQKAIKKTQMFSVDATTWQSGMYFMQLKTFEGSLNYKIMKE